MQRKFFNRISLLLATAATAALMLGGCSGSNGKDGANGANATSGTVNASTFSDDNLNNVVLNGKILSASIPGKNPVVDFQITDKVSGAGITGLKTFALHIAKLIPEDTTAGTSSYWVNYIDKGIAIPAGSGTGATAATKPSADPGNSFNTDGSVKVKGYTVVDNGDGTYRVTFASDITSNTNVDGIHGYDPSLVHRIAIAVSSIATPGVTATGPLNAAGVVNTSFVAQNRLAMTYDFIPATGAVLTTPARDIVTADACNQCHYKLTTIIGHTGSRPDVKVCVMCHTSTNASGEGEFVTFIHRIHMGEKLNEGGSFKPIAKGLVTYGEQTYPQDIRNCTECHKGADVNNWMTKPNRKNCGSCHNAIDFATGANHNSNGAPGAQANDKGCALCHSSAAVSAVHLPVAKVDPLNALSVYAGAPYNGVFSAYSAAFQANGRVAPGSPNSNTNAATTAAASLSRLPAGAKAISYVISEVGRNSSKQPFMKFKFQVATADASGVLGTPVDVVFNTSNGTNEMITGFAGSPSVYFAFAVPQDGIAAPADFNATVSVYLKRVWDGTIVAKEGAAKAATLSAPANGVYTLTMTGVIIPDSAVMLTGGLGYTYGLGSAMTKVSGKYVPFATTTQPLTQTDLSAFPYTPVAGTGIGIGGLSVPADNKWKSGTGYKARRTIVDNDKCNKCHGRLGVNPTFHAGQRNDAPTCTFCHNVNRVNNGWAVNSKDIIHAIHGSGKRVNKFSWEASAGATYWKVTYPGYLRNCEECHVAGMYDFSNSVYTTSLFDSLLYTTAATGKIDAVANVITTGNETIPGKYYSPFVTAGANYGNGFSYAASATGGTTVEAAATTLVNSPIAAACAGCHDTTVARAHMNTFGGSISTDRTTALGKKETCAVCHGTAANALNATVPAIKLVHRWW